MHSNVATIKNVSLKSFHPQKTNKRSNEKASALNMKNIHSIRTNELKARSRLIARKDTNCSQNVSQILKANDLFFPSK